MSYFHTTYHIAFPLQQWLRGRGSMLRYTHTACLVKTCTETPKDDQLSTEMCCVQKEESVSEGNTDCLLDYMYRTGNYHQIVSPLPGMFACTVY